MDNNYAFLGTGWSFPPSFADNGGYVHTVSGTDDVFESIKIITTTEPEERTMQPDFGCALSGFAFTGITEALLSKIEGIIQNALIMHERRINLESVNVAQDENDMGILKISVDYVVPESNSRFNMVFPYYLNEAQ